ncbi:magnesium transporter [Endothiovibrio diazotrophicus]
MSSERFEHILRQVNELLDKQELEQELVHHQQGPQQAVVENLVARQHQAKLDARLSDLHVADVARVMEMLPLERRRRVWRRVWSRMGGDLLLELGDSVRRQVIEECDEDTLSAVLAQLDGDDLVYLAADLPPALLERRLATLSADERVWLAAGRNYPEDSVGFLMTNEMVVVREEQRLGEVLEGLRGRAELPEQNDKLMVVDRRGHLSGVLPWQTLLLTPPERAVGACMARDVVTFHPEEGAGKAAQAFDRYDLISAPVVNDRGKPIGRLTIDVVMEFVSDRAAEDALRPSGVREEEDLFAPIWNSARNRWAWISLSLLTAFFSAKVIGLFEEAIAHVVALAALMPIVTAVGGNTGNQTTALVLRGLALEQVHRDNLGHLVRKELGLSLVSGGVWGSVVGLFALLSYGDIHLAGVIGVSMVFTLLVSVLLALGIPLGLHAMGRDPALGSSVLVTALTDAIGFFIFLGLATIWLL